jgi:hypothetical protein
MVFMNYQWVIVDAHRQAGLANPKWASPRCPKFLILDTPSDIVLVQFAYPRCSMYGIFTYIWVILVVNVAKYSIHGASGYGSTVFPKFFDHQFCGFQMAQIGGDR